MDLHKIKRFKQTKLTIPISYSFIGNLNFSLSIIQWNMYRNIRANKKNFLKAIWKKIYDLRNTEYVFILCRILWMLNETISNIKATHFYSYL